MRERREAWRQWQFRCKQIIVMRVQAVSGVWNESDTPADRFDWNKEPAKHRMPERQSRMQWSTGSDILQASRVIYAVSIYKNQCRLATLRLLQSTGRDSDNPPSCVVSLSQTRLYRDRPVPSEQWDYPILTFREAGEPGVINIFPIFFSFTSEGSLIDLLHFHSRVNFIVKEEPESGAILIETFVVPMSLVFRFQNQIKFLFVLAESRRERQLNM